MTAAQHAIDSAVREADRLLKAIRSGSKQVRRRNDQQLIMATAFAWFNKHRKTIGGALVGEDLKALDGDYQALLSGAARATLRTKYIDTLKSIKKSLAKLRADQAIALSDASSGATVRSSSDAPPVFAALIGDPAMQTILTRRWQECVACIEARAPLAATVMMGGILEGLLLARINQLTDKSPVFSASAAPRKNGKTLPLKDWALKNYVDVAHELGWISKAAKDIGEVVRDYRNYIHPQKELSHGIQISSEDARMMWEVAKSVTRQILETE